MSYVKTSLSLSILSLALAGCGGGDGDSSSTPSTPGPQPVDISSYTVIDGYLTNMLVFIDSNKDLRFQNGETIIGLTDAQGRVDASQINIMPDDQVVAEAITLKNSSKFPAQYQRSYTYDQDAPMNHFSDPFSLATTADNAVITPLSDIVVRLMNEQGMTEEEAKSFLLELLNKLGIDDIYQNHILNDDKVLKKVNQILLFSRMVDPDGYEKLYQELIALIIDIIQEMTAEQIEDHRFIIIPNRGPNTIAVVSAEQAALIQAQLQQQFSQPNFNFDVDFRSLFIDPDTNEDIVYFYGDQINAMGIEISQEPTDGVVSFSGSFDGSQSFDLSVMKFDISANGSRLDPKIVNFALSINGGEVSDNQKPVIQQERLEGLQWLFDSIELRQNQNISIDFETAFLFHDEENDPLKYRLQTNVPGMSFNCHVADCGTAVTFSGTPTDQLTNAWIKIDTNDGQHGPESSASSWSEVAKIDLGDITPDSNVDPRCSAYTSFSTERLNWDDAANYCASLGANLPSQGDLLQLHTDVETRSVCGWPDYHIWSNTSGGGSNYWAFNNKNYFHTTWDKSREFEVTCKR
ncbi:C-type lectin domain-containing protein [Ferrimonas aestuarii]|uniref:C-type lectin domain-containing protein n=1 Tax=Ferrimonas aestuarii TaxID=2569539 RepID=A0A4U1BV56_9GAMM|nr:C-type lectin domain-containing protein [Ferrimonas aestuarii]TKB56701.1 C-type lectin domain-containing protein [Ferrimonas aestuarii]